MGRTFGPDQHGSLCCLRSNLLQSPPRRLWSIVSRSVPADPREEELRPVRWPNVLLLVVALLWLATLGVVAAAAVYEISHAQLIHRGVWVSYVDLSDLTEEQAAEALEAAGLVLPPRP